MKNNSQKEKIRKNNRFKHELKMTCLFNFLRLLEVDEKLGKKVERAVISDDFERRYTCKRCPFDSGVLFYCLTFLTCILFNQPVRS